MAKSALWRITAVDTQGQDLVLSRLRLLASSTRVDSGAVLTCTAAPVSGALADLLDDSAASCRFAAADVSAPGFQIVFTLPAQQDVNGVELGLVSVAASPVALALEFLADGIYTVRSDFKGIETAGSPKIQQVGEVIAGTPQQGYIVAVVAGSGNPLLNAFDQVAPTWDANFRQTIDIGLFAYQGTNPGETGVQPSKVIPQFSLDDKLKLFLLNGSWNPDYADMDMEFLRSDGTVVAAIRSEYRHAYAARMLYGSSLSTMTDPGFVGSYPCIDGVLTFTAGSMTFTPTAAATNNNHNGWVLQGAFSEVVALRFSRVRASSNYPGRAGAIVSVNRMGGVARYGYTGILPYKSIVAVGVKVVSGAQSIDPANPSVRVLRVSQFHDAEHGGRGMLYGRVTIDGLPSGTPVSRRVRLFRSRDGCLVREVWSAADGSYRFEGINERYEYDIEAWDHEKNYFSAVANNQIPEVAA